MSRGGGGIVSIQWKSMTKYLLCSVFKAECAQHILEDVSRWLFLFDCLSIFPSNTKRDIKNTSSAKSCLLSFGPKQLWLQQVMHDILVLFLFLTLIARKPAPSTVKSQWSKIPVHILSNTFQFCSFTESFAFIKDAKWLGLWSLNRHFILHKVKSGKQLYKCLPEVLPVSSKSILPRWRTPATTLKRLSFSVSSRPIFFMAATILLKSPRSSSKGSFKAPVFPCYRHMHLKHMPFAPSTTTAHVTHTANAAEGNAMAKPEVRTVYWTMYTDPDLWLKKEKTTPEGQSVPAHHYDSLSVQMSVIWWKPPYSS